MITTPARRGVDWLQVVNYPPMSYTVRTRHSRRTAGEGERGRKADGRGETGDGESRGTWCPPLGMKNFLDKMNQRE